MFGEVEPAVSYQEERPLHTRLMCGSGSIFYNVASLLSDDLTHGEHRTYAEDNGLGSDREIYVPQPVLIIFILVYTRLDHSNFTSTSPKTFSVMPSTTLGGLCLMAGLANFVSAFPSTPVGPAFVRPAHCEDYGECIETTVFGYKVQRLVSNATLIATGLDRRQSEPETNVDVGQDQVEQQTLAYDGEEPPAAVFGSLWDRITEACFSNTCDGNSPVTAGNYQLSVTGQFADTGSRDNFVSLLREAFFRTQTDEVETSVITVPGPSPAIPGGQRQQKVRYTKAVDFLNANIFGGENSGQFMTVRVTQVSSGAGCPSYLNAINAGGALVPALAPFFGVISVVCAALG